MIIINSILILKFIIPVSFLYLCLYMVFNTIAKYTVLNFSVIDYLSKLLLTLGLKTTIKSDPNLSACYDTENDIIEISSKNSLKSFVEGLHEIGHAFYDKNSNYRVYDRFNNLLDYSYFVRKEVNSNIFLIFIFSKGIIFSIIFTFIGMCFNLNILIYISIIISIISTFLHSLNLCEEVKASIIAYDILINDKPLNHKDTIFSYIFLKLGFLTYFIINTFSIFILLINIFYIFNYIR